MERLRIQPGDSTRLTFTFLCPVILAVSLGLSSLPLKKG